MPPHDPPALPTSAEPAEAARPVEGSSRALPMPLLWITVTLLAARLITGFWEGRHPPPVADRVEWQPIESAVARARSLGRPILYDFSAEWCAPCQVMEREVFADRQAAASINARFVPVRVMDRVREEGRNPPVVGALQARYRVTGFPTLVIVSPDGGEPVTIEGYPGRAELTRRLTEAGIRTRATTRLTPQGVRADTAR